MRQALEDQRRLQGAVLVLESLRQDVQDRPGGEQQDRRRYRRHRARDKGIAATRQLAKRQLTWFRRHGNCEWMELQPDNSADEILAMLATRG